MLKKTTDILPKLLFLVILVIFSNTNYAQYEQTVWKWGFENIEAVDSNFLQKYHFRDERGKKPAIELVTDAAKVNSGSKAIMLYNTQPDSSFMWPSFWLILSDDSVALAPKTEYKLKFKVKGYRGGTKYSMWNVDFWKFLPDKQSWYNKDITLKQDFLEWSQLEFDITTPEDTTNMTSDFTIAFNVPKGIADTLYLDDFEMVKITQPEFNWTRELDADSIPNTEFAKALLKFGDASLRRSDLALDKTLGHNGTNSLKLFNQEPANPMAPVINITVDSAFASQGVYEISFWARGNVSEKALLRVNSKQTSFINESFSASNLGIDTTKWTQVKFKARTPFNEDFFDDGYKLTYIEEAGDYFLNVDDFKVEWVAANPNVTANIGFEEPNNDGDWPWGWSKGDAWGGLYRNWGKYPGATSNPDIDSIPFCWDNTVSYEGNYSLRMQVTNKDVEFVMIKEGKRPFESGFSTSHQAFNESGLYEVNFRVKIENFVEGLGDKGTWFALRPGFNSHGGSVVTINKQSFIDAGNPEWLHVKDTILFPAKNPNNNKMLIYFSGAIPFADTADFDVTKTPRAWFDNFEFKYLGKTVTPLDPMAADGFVAERDSASNDVTLKWKAVNGVSNAVYHILVEPDDPSNKGDYAVNFIKNPGFENGNNDGSLPTDWVWRPLGADQHTTKFGKDAAGGDIVNLDYPYQENDVIAGQSAVAIGELDSSSRKNGVVAWIEQQVNSPGIKYNNAYLYGTMVQYDNIHSVNTGEMGDKFTNTKSYYYPETYTLPEGRPYYNDAGVHIQIGKWTWGHTSPRLFKQGYTDLVGSSNDKWVKHKLALSFDEICYNSVIGVGLGGERSWRSTYWGATTGASGEAIFDNVFITPFEELATTTELTYTIKNVPKDKKWFAVYVEDPSGALLPSAAAVTSSLASEFLITDVDDNTIPLEFTLDQNYPNPFNPTTKIQYSIPVKQKVELFIYDILGRKVLTLVNKVQNSGKYSVNFNASQLATGVYFYQIKTDNFIKTKKMMLLK